ncbi:MAG TPA: alpha/beta fold hydrolase [Miltoncostaeaceae bacterium]|nr:alpha/beta fold hydrolase [Miltoncostaeaceae bacterium]
MSWRARGGGARVAIGLVLCLAAVAVLPATRAAAAFAPCPGKAGIDCQTVEVPLDRTGTVPGTVPLHVERLPARLGATAAPVVAIAGGPGQAATELIRSFDAVLAPVLDHRDLIVVDQRGTGDSGPISCAAIGIFRLLTTAGGSSCAAELGPARAFYSTRDAAEDLEAVRVAVGAPRVALYGVSYGTKVASLFAAAHPSSVERVVLDSVVPPQPADPFNRSSFTAIRRVLTTLCSGHRCAGVTADPYGDLVALARRLDRAPIRGTAVGRTGRRRPVAVSDRTMLDLLFAGDLDPTLRLDLPGAVRSALRGDDQPLLRLSHRATDTTAIAQPAAFSTALFATTTCDDLAAPWPAAAALEDRPGLLRAAIAGVPDEAFAPFGRDVALDESAAALCLAWPSDPRGPAAPAAAPPPVPALALAGTADLRTPIEDARAVASSFPGGRVVAVPGGHSVLTTDRSGCAARALVAFFADQTEPTCRIARLRLPAMPVAPASLRSVHPIGQAGAQRGRVTAAAILTIRDVLRAVISAQTTARSPRDLRVGGLRGGTFRIADTTVHLSGVVYVPGVAVSGRLLTDGGPTLADVRFAGAGRGRLTVDADGNVRGVVDGRSVTARVPVGAGTGAFALLL